MILQHGSQPLRDHSQPLLQRPLDGGADHAMSQNAVTAAVAFDHAPAGALGSAVDPQNTHGLGGQRLHLLFVDVEVGIHVLHVVVLFQSLAQPQHGAGIFAELPGCDAAGIETLPAAHGSFCVTDEVGEVTGITESSDSNIIRAQVCVRSLKAMASLGYK